jgi:hyperosmotically inducible protein
MQGRNPSRPVVWLLALIVAAPLALGCGGRSVGETIDDATITARVKTVLLNDPQVSGMRIDVDTVQGVVTMSGIVESKAEEERAIQLARSVNGVRDVRSTLQVNP